jgi:RNA polymerase sigma factor (sigma-70 family)
MTSGEFDLGQCLDQVRRLDQDAAGKLVEQLHPLVIRIVRSHLPRRTLEEDLAQEIFVKLFDRLGQYQARSGVPFEHWVARLAVRTCLDALRAERRRPELRWGDLPEDQVAWLQFMLADQTVAAPETSASSAREVVETLLTQLPPKDRLVLTLLDLEQRSVKEIADLTGWSVTLVKVRAFRARRKLRALAKTLENQERYEKF